MHLWYHKELKNTMTKQISPLGISVLVLSSVFSVSAVAQTPSSTSATDQSTTSSNTTTKSAADDSSTYATGKPLEQQSKEGFWGHINPLARKKWVKRQVEPIRDRTNELDQLQSKNRTDIHDVDSRAQSGISKAMTAAGTADQHAADAATRAGAANTLAGNASSKTDTLRGTVSNLDQYQTVSSTAVPFVAGHTTLGKTAKVSLDDVASKLASEKGYIVEVEGFSRSGVQASQAMADSVVRYLVTEHQVPVFRIYKSGLGKQTATVTEGEKPLTNGVRVTLLHNSLATMGTTTSSTGATSGSQTGTSNPPSNQ